MENSIFDYINPNDNDKLSKLNKLKLLKLMHYLNEYPLSLRESINLNSDTTFGIEIEVEKANKRKIKRTLRKESLNWCAHHDFSLTKGIELSSGILTDKKESWQEIKKVCNLLEENSQIDLHCGGHVHLGGHIIGDNPEYWMNLCNLWITYENIIYRFGYGEYLTPRISIGKYAYPVARLFAKDRAYFKRNLTANEIVKILDVDKYQGINFHNVHNLNRKVKKNTIEFRSPNGTLDPVIWQNNINFFSKMIEYSKSEDFDKEKIMSDRLNLKEYNLNNYNKIYMQRALDLCDMLYNNNLDKLYFLRQYLKNFQTNNNTLVKGKSFTKKEV